MDWTQTIRHGASSIATGLKAHGDGHETSYCQAYELLACCEIGCRHQVLEAMWRARAPSGMPDGSGVKGQHVSLMPHTGVRRQQYLLPPEMLRAHAPRWPCPEVSSGHFRQAPHVLRVG